MWFKFDYFLKRWLKRETNSFRSIKSNIHNTQKKNKTFGKVSSFSLRKIWTQRQKKRSCQNWKSTQVSPISRTNDWWSPQRAHHWKMYQAKHLDIIKASSGTRNVVGVKVKIDRSKLTVGARVALDQTTLTIMRVLPREVDPMVFNMMS